MGEGKEKTGDCRRDMMMGRQEDRRDTMMKRQGDRRDMVMGRQERHDDGETGET